jgi:endonuclease YncB( thermonuclease family)
MSRLVANGQVTCELSGEMTYDREAGTCYLASGEDLASILIQRGICGRCAVYDPDERYLRDQAQAGPFQGVTPAYCRK